MKMCRQAEKKSEIVKKEKKQETEKKQLQNKLEKSKKVLKKVQEK